MIIMMRGLVAPDTTLFYEDCELGHEQGRVVDWHGQSFSLVD